MCTILITQEKVKVWERMICIFLLISELRNSLPKHFYNYAKFKKQLSYASCSKYQVTEKLKPNSMCFSAPFKGGERTPLEL